MTRTRTGEYKEAENAPRERRLARNGNSDIRAIPKKAGGGAGNWGVPGSELDAQEALASPLHPFHIKNEHVPAVPIQDVAE
ncbi:hypothetical protein BGW42_001743 [Actinomortierella wolfii]|nr:hypothetical protein BGW42_001743 [Actinomortierella wolfii]